MDWKILAIITPIFFISYQALSKLLPKTISAFLVNAYASFIGMMLMFLLHFFFSQNKSLTLPAKYIPIALGIGALISIGNFFIIKAYSLGAPQSTFSAMFYSLLIIYAVFIGIFIWHEKLSFIQIAGAALSVLGIFLMIYFKK